MTSAFKDHFSGHAADYSTYRPEYPPELFAWLASLCKEHQLAWDCATGNGQAAVELTNHFSYVIGTDASAEQIYQALDYPRVEYQVAPAEKTEFKDQSVDLITVAQALHWFDFDGFFNEVRRVLKPEGILAVWTYALHQITPEVDAVIEKLYNGLTGPYWPEERKHIENSMADIEFPFTPVKSPKCTMQKHWSFSHLVGYLNTWSATQRYIKDKGHNPVELVAEELHAAWGTDTETRLVTWPVTLKVFKL